MMLKKWWSFGHHRRKAQDWSAWPVGCWAPLDTARYLASVMSIALYVVHANNRAVFYQSVQLDGRRLRWWFSCWLVGGVVGIARRSPQPSEPDELFVIDIKGGSVTFLLQLVFCKPIQRYAPPEHLSAISKGLPPLTDRDPKIPCGMEQPNNHLVDQQLIA